MCWVQGHCGIAGNDTADIQAKAASSSVEGLRQRKAILHTDMTCIIKAAVRKQWQGEWSLVEDQEKQLREMKTVFEHWSFSCNKIW